MRVFYILARLPFLGIFVQTYLTAYYAREWGEYDFAGDGADADFSDHAGTRFPAL